MDKRKSFLSDWKLLDRGTHFVLSGKIHNDDRFEDGEYIISSRILNIDFANNLCETKNTIYSLKESLDGKQ